MATNLVYTLPAGGIRATITADGSSGNVVVAGNSSASFLTSNGSEVVIGATVNKVIYGAGGNNAYWTLARGANIVGVYQGSGWIDYASLKEPLNLYPTANIVLTLVGSGNGFIIVETVKQSHF